MKRSSEAEWYRDWFDQDYLELYAHRDQVEADRFVDTIWDRMNVTPGVRVGDFPCGPGRHSRSFALKGAIVTGIDLSPFMVRRARETVAGLSPEPRILRADLRALPLVPQFDLVANLFTSFGYFEDEIENETVFGELARVVSPGGRLIIETANREAVVANFNRAEQFTFGSLQVDIRRELIESGRRVEKRMRLLKDGRERRIVERVRLYRPEEMESLARTKGLTVLELWGDYEGHPYTTHSPRMILIAGKR